MLKGFFHDSGLSLRDIAQAFHHLGLVLSSLRSDQRSFAMAAAVALILRTIEPGLYHRFLRGEASDLEVVDTLFGRPGLGTLREQEGNQLARPAAVFEAIVIAGAQEMKASDERRRGPITSPLLQRYNNLLESVQEDQQQEHASNVINLLKALQNNLIPGGLGFMFAVQRLELLSSSLIADVEAAHEQQ